MSRRAIVAILAPLVLSGCWPWHMFAGGPACKYAVNSRAKKVTVGTTTVPIASGGEGAQVRQIEVGADVAREASDVVQQFDQLQYSNCETTHALKSPERPPYANMQIQLVTDFAFALRELNAAINEREYMGALNDARARLESDRRAAAQVGCQ